MSLTFMNLSMVSCGDDDPEPQPEPQPTPQPTSYETLIIGKWITRDWYLEFIAGGDGYVKAIDDDLEQITWYITGDKLVIKWPSGNMYISTIISLNNTSMTLNFDEDNSGDGVLKVFNRI